MKTTEASKWKNGYNEHQSFPTYSNSQYAISYQTFCIFQFTLILTFSTLADSPIQIDLQNMETTPHLPKLKMISWIIVALNTTIPWRKNTQNGIKKHSWGWFILYLSRFMWDIGDGCVEWLQWNAPWMLHALGLICFCPFHWSVHYKSSAVIKKAHGKYSHGSNEGEYEH